MRLNMLTTINTHARPKSKPPVGRYLQELGVEAQQLDLDFKAKEHKDPEFLKVNPFGKLPALSDGGFNLVRLLGAAG
jgi:hypothetical protein